SDERLDGSRLEDARAVRRGDLVVAAGLDVDVLHAVQMQQARQEQSRRPGSDDDDAGGLDRHDRDSPVASTSASPSLSCNSATVVSKVSSTRGVMGAPFASRPTSITATSL